MTSARRQEIAKQFVDHDEASIPTPWSLDQTDSDFINRMLPALLEETGDAH